MRVLILAALLLGSSSLCPSFAQEQERPPQEKPSQAKPAVEVPQSGAAPRTEENSEPSREQRSRRDPSRADDREMGQDWRMRRGDGERMGRDRSEMGFEGRMRRDGERIGREDREMGAPGMQRDRDWDRGRYGGRGGRDGDYSDRDKDTRRYFDEEAPRRRIKVCVEYENGDEYCRYRR